MKTKLIIVGGFLGAGKTTLLHEAARRLQLRGRRVGLITNDQASGLVDTAFLASEADNVHEVSGSCFCCNFAGLVDAVSNIREHGGDCVVAEPVGSCTDLSATLLQPLKDRFSDELEMAPLTVLADPRRISEILSGAPSGIHPGARYIIEKQLEEADLIFINKSDLADLGKIVPLAKERWKQAKVISGSALNGMGVNLWLDYVLGHSEAGTHLVDVDYDKYAEGEAALGWLNARFSLHGKDADWDMLARRLTESFSKKLDSMNAAVGHVKILLESGGASVAGNITGKMDTVSIRRSAGRGDFAELTLNARVEMAPEELKTLAIDEIGLVCGSDVVFSLEEINSLAPGRPEPTYRYDRVV